MKIFITGASGFIGGAVLDKLANIHEFMAMARSEKSAEKVKARGATPVQCELGKVLPEHLEGCETVIHSAAFVEPWGTKEQFWEANVEGTSQLMEAARKAGVKRFIHIGSESVLFRGQDAINIDETYPYAENTPYIYAATKQEAEKRVIAANEPGVFETISIRPRLVWGPGDTTIQVNLMEMVDNGSFRWINHGKARTTTTHVYNLVEGIRLAIDKARGGEIYFVTDDEVHSFRDFITMMLDSAGRVPKNRSLPAGLAKFAARLIEGTWKLFGIKSKPPVTRLSVGIMTATCIINIDKAKKELGYKPVISVKEGFAQLKKLTLG